MKRVGYSHRQHVEEGQENVSDGRMGFIQDERAVGRRLCLQLRPFPPDFVTMAVRSVPKLVVPVFQ